MTTHQTIRRNPDGTLDSFDCPCGEDHGPSLHEELEIMRASNRRQARHLAALRADMVRVLELTKAETLNGANRIKARRLVSQAAKTAAAVARDLTVLC